LTLYFYFLLMCILFSFLFCTVMDSFGDNTFHSLIARFLIWTLSLDG
jgi:hypothetical protein